jgi:Cd2+/Zn2+-exporting ATPase
MNETQTLTFQIDGIDCADCARTIENGVGRLEGVGSCRVNFASAKLYVDGSAPEATIVARVRELGYDVAEADVAPRPPQNFLQFMWSQTETRLALLGAILIVPGVVLGEIMGRELLWVNVLALGALVAAGWPIARSAWRSLYINRAITINVLMTVAAVGAVLIGAYVEAGMVMVLFAIGEALEGYTTERARHSIRSLMEVAPETATRIRTAGGEPAHEVVDIHLLEPGDLIAVRPGERIPMDGEVVAGTSSVNQAPITGESRLLEKSAGDRVFASSINGPGALEIEVTQPAENNTINRVIRMVEEAQEHRAPAQRLVDRFAAVYTPAVMVLAILVAAIPPLFLNQPFLNPGDGSFGWLYRGLALLVVACPCALVISTPVTIISAISNAARRGVLIKGGAYLETLASIDAVALDKTGTITYGRPIVQSVRTLECADGTPPDSIEDAAGCACDDGCCATAPTAVAACPACDELLALAGAVEQRSEHALARAIVQEAEARGVMTRYGAGATVTALAGLGVEGQVNGRRVLIGSHTYFDANVPHDPAHCAEATAAAGRGATPVLVSVDDVYRGTITVADKVRASSPAAIAELHDAGIEHIIMLTGDDPAAAAVIAAEVGVTDVRAGLLPGDKLSAVRELQETFGPIAMVGDGINDAPALVAADVGIAMGGALGGTDQAMESADIVLMNDDLARLPFVFRLSRKSRNTIWFNIAFSIAIKFLFMLLVIAGLGSMWMAVLADVGTSLLVTLNGMRLLRWDGGRGGTGREAQSFGKP